MKREWKMCLVCLLWEWDICYSSIFLPKSNVRMCTLEHFCTFPLSSTWESKSGEMQFPSLNLQLKQNSCWEKNNTLEGNWIEFKCSTSFSWILSPLLRQFSNSSIPSSRVSLLVYTCRGSLVSLLIISFVGDEKEEKRKSSLIPFSHRKKDHLHQL